MTTVMNDEKRTSEAEVQPEKEQAANSNSNSKDVNPVKFYKKLVQEAHELAKADDVQKAETALDELSHKWSDGPEAESEEQDEKIKDLFYKFTKVTESFEQRKQADAKQKQELRKENISRKRNLLKKLKKIVNQKDWGARGKVRSIQNKWNNVGSIPHEVHEKLQDEFGSLITEFKSHKVDQIVEKRKKQEDNLMLKMTVLDKMEKVAGSLNEQTSEWKKIDDKFDKLTRQWKKIGRVPHEKADNTWQRYKAAQDAYYDAKYKFNKQHRKKVDKFTAKKEKLCRQAEGLVELDLLKAGRKVNGLHRRWKKAGNLPQRKEDELWDRFKAAIDAFNQKKADNKEELEEREQANVEKKEELIAAANDIKNTEDWKKGHNKMQTLMDRWKKSGPVTQRHSNQLWKKFKGAMDHFYDRRREHFKESEERQKKNLKKKKEILEQLHELGEHEDPIKAVSKAKPLQTEFKDVGYVPIEKKNEMWKKYRKACDVIYNRMRAAKSGDKFDKELAKASLDREQRAEIQQLRKEYKKAEKEAEQLKEDVLQYQESKSYFTSSDDDNPLLAEMQEKINKAQKQLDEKEDHLAELDKKMDMIKEEQ